MPTALLLFFGLVAGLAVSDPPTTRTLAAAPSDGAISVDGRLDEAAWQTAEVASGFRQFEPNEGAPATQRTEVRVLYGPSALYVGATLHDDAPALVRQPLSRRDDTGDADYFLVGIDGYFDRRTAYLFAVTAAGVQIDLVQNEGSADRSWDAVWTSDVRVTATGWVAEIEIPYSMLRFNRAAEQTWGVQFERHVARNSETAHWEPVTRAEQGQGLIFGQLTGLRDLAPRRTLQVRPYTLSRVRSLEDAATPGTADTDLGADVGGDLKVGLASNLILDATVNPDFGQVEADPAVLNLSTFETFFEERRPFFLEGTAIFDYTIDSGRDGRLLYTRRIGGFDPIIAASKLTGRTDGGLSVGALGALTGRDFGPSRFYGTARAKQELGTRSHVGAGLAYYDAFETNSIGGRRSLVGGGDWDIRLGSGTYRWDGSATLSTRRASGQPELDNSGFAVYTGLDKIRGNTTWGSGLRVYSDTFRPDDLGRLQQNDLVRVGFGGSTYLNGGEPLGPFRRVRLSLFADQTWRYRDGANRGFGLTWSSVWERKNFSEVSVRGSLGGLGGVDVRETRGLGTIRNRRGGGITASYATDSRRRFVIEPEVGADVQEGGGFGWNTAVELAWNASDRVDLAFFAEYVQRDGFTAWAANEFFRETDGGFFVGAEPGLPASPDEVVRFGDALDPAFSGLPFYGGEPGYYFLPVFGARDTREVDLSLRTNVVFRPNLSLQLYSQLFAARGRFRDFRLLAAPDDLRDFEAYPKRRDLSLQALVANVVLRWEYRPGSTLFVVWAHNRNDGLDDLRFADQAGDAPFDAGALTQLGDTFALFPENVVLVKLSYLLMR